MIIVRDRDEFEVNAPIRYYCTYRDSIVFMLLVFVIWIIDCISVDPECFYTLSILYSVQSLVWTDMT